jgi:sulfonate transport system permease protein
MSGPRTAGGAKLVRGSRLRWLRRGVSVVVLLALWQLAVSLGWLSDRTLASPAEVASAFGTLVSDGTLAHHLLISLRRAVLGLALGGSLAVVLAALTGLSRLAEDVFDAPIQMARTLPHLGLVPLFILWFGIGEQPKVLLVALGSFFPIYLNVYAGIRGVDTKLVDAARSCGLGRLGLVRDVVLPGALPSALVGLRYSLGVAWLSLVVAEQVNASDGIGYLMMDAREFNRTDVLLVGLFVYAVLGLVSDLAVRLGEGRTLSWRSSFAGT